MTPRYSVGQTLWWVGRNNSKSQGKVTIKKVGRVWLELSNNHRVDIETLLADGKGYSAPGECWFDRETYQAHADLHKAWQKLIYTMSGQYGRIPKGVTAEDVNKASELLGLSKEGGAA